MPAANTIPSNGCDAHAHVFGPLARFPYAADRSYTPDEAPVEDYLRVLGELELERAVIVQPSVYGLDNRCTVEAIRRIGLHRARGVAAIDASADTAELSGLHDAGVRAARCVISKRGGPSAESLPKIARRIEPFGWHIEMFAPARLWPDLLPLVKDLPVPLVFDHMADMPANTSRSDPALSRILDLLQEDRFWIKLIGYRNSIAGRPFADLRGIARLFIQSAPDRCIWGTDWPHPQYEGPAPEDAELLGLVEDWAPDPVVLRKILVDNPAALYGFDR